MEEAEVRDRVDPIVKDGFEPSNEDDDWAKSVVNSRLPIPTHDTYKCTLGQLVALHQLCHRLKFRKKDHEYFFEKFWRRDDEMIALRKTHLRDWVATVLIAHAYNSLVRQAEDLQRGAAAIPAEHWAKVVRYHLLRPHDILHATPRFDFRVGVQLDKLDKALLELQASLMDSDAREAEAKESKDSTKFFVCDRCGERWASDRALSAHRRGECEPPETSDVEMDLEEALQNADGTESESEDESAVPLRDKLKARIDILTKVSVPSG